jgi:hypothetical protein
VEDPDFAKQNDRDPAARPLTDFPTKLLKQGFNVPPRQAAAYKTGEDQLKGALVLPLHSVMVLPPSTRRGCLSTACRIRITLKIRSGKGFKVMRTISCSRLLDLDVRQQIGVMHSQRAGSAPIVVEMKTTEEKTAKIHAVVSG